MGLPFSLPLKEDIISLNKIVDKIYDEIVEKAEKKEMDFETVHLAVLRVLNAINSCMPGMQYDPPSQQDVKDFYDKWKQIAEKEKKAELKKFIEELLRKSYKSNINTVVTGVVAPPVAMIAKRVGQQVPPLKKTLSFIPDAVFVPACTIAALFTVKMVQKNVMEQIRKAA